MADINALKKRLQEVKDWIGRFNYDELDRNGRNEFESYCDYAEFLTESIRKAEEEEAAWTQHKLGACAS